MRMSILFAALLATSPAHADPVNDALNAAATAFAQARPALGATAFGVDVAAYGDALTLGRSSSAHWGQPLTLEVVQRAAPEGSCSRYAAFVRLPPENGTVSLVICPQFTEEGSDPLRRLTVLHEMVHVVAGPDECRAMAFAAQVEHLATGAHTPVDAYWQANGCESSGLSLP
jgi:hypothetical protein